MDFENDDILKEQVLALEACHLQALNDVASSEVSGIDAGHARSRLENIKEHLRQARALVGSLNPHQTPAEDQPLDFRQNFTLNPSQSVEPVPTRDSVVDDDVIALPTRPSGFFNNSPRETLNTPRDIKRIKTLQPTCSSKAKEEKLPAFQFPSQFMASSPINSTSAFPSQKLPLNSQVSDGRLYLNIVQNGFKKFQVIATQTTPFLKVFQAVSKKLNIGVETVTFLYEGRNIQPHWNPSYLGMLASQQYNLEVKAVLNPDSKTINIIFEIYSADFALTKTITLPFNTLYPFANIMAHVKLLLGSPKVEMDAYFRKKPISPQENPTTLSMMDGSKIIVIYRGEPTENKSKCFEPYFEMSSFGQMIMPSGSAAPEYERPIDSKEAEKQIEKLLDTFSVEIPKEERISVSENLITVKLKEYQRIGVTWMSRMENSLHKGGINSDEMGLGKTVQTIACMLLNQPTENVCNSPSSTFKKRLNSRPKFRTLIVVPVSLMDQWHDELLKFVHPSLRIRVLRYHSAFLKQSERKSLEDDPEHLYRYDVVLTTYSGVAQQFPFDKENRRQYTMNRYEFNRKEGGPIFQIKWFRCILDEAHYIKNRQSISSIACSYLEAERRWCLTGTPIQNSSDDLFSLFRFLKIEPYCNWVRFTQDLSVNPSKSAQIRSQSQRLKKLQTVLHCCLLRRTKNTRIDGENETIVKLPVKEIVSDNPKFSEYERKFYETFEAKSLSMFNKMLDNLERNYRSILVMIMRMRQICLHYSLVASKKNIDSDFDETKLRKILNSLDSDVVEKMVTMCSSLEEDCTICSMPLTQPAITKCGHSFCYECIIDLLSSENQDGCPTCKTSLKKGEIVLLSHVRKLFNIENEDNEELETLVEPNALKRSGPSTKINRLMDILNQTSIEAPTEKTIVFCSFTAMLDLVELELNKKQFKFTRLDGSMNIRERMDAVKTFSTDPSYSVMLISMRCGSVGLNLIAANRVVLLDVWWNPALENQAIDRVHRIGQTAEKVIVIKITITNTIEDRIVDLQRKKQDLTDQALNEVEHGNSNSTMRRLSKNELIYLFKGGQSPIE